MFALSRAVMIAAALVAGFSLRGAQADFYTLDGKFACLESEDTACASKDHAAQMLEPKAGKPAETEKGPIVADHDPVLQAPTTLTPGKQEKNSRSLDPLVEIAGRIEAGKPSGEDFTHLRKQSRSGDGRAIELLAWCDYFGIGVPRDPVAAYILYGIAALAGVAGAGENQAVIYEYVLTPDQRQLVLDIQNDDIE